MQPFFSIYITTKAWIAWISRGQYLDSKADHTLTTAYPHGLPQFRTVPLPHPIHTTTMATEITSFFIDTVDSATRSG